MRRSPRYAATRRITCDTVSMTLLFRPGDDRRAREVKAETTRPRRKAFLVSRMPSHTHPARGMRDFLPEEVRRRQYVIDIVRGAYERYGFEPLETPALENIDTLTGKYGEEGNKLIFKVLRRGEHE